MAAPRSISIRVLRQLSAYSRQVRHLHMTAVAASPSRILSIEKPITDVASLKAERSKQLAADMAGVMSTQTRNISTSRSIRARNDSSTIDFMYFPQFSAAELAGENADYDASFRVPRLPIDVFPSQGGPAPVPDAALEEDLPVQRSIIHTVAGDSSHISAGGTLSDVHDASAAHLDFEGMVEKLTSTADSMVAEVEKSSPEAAGVVRQVWEGLLDDLFGARKKSGSA